MQLSHISLSHERNMELFYEVLCKQWMIGYIYLTLVFFFYQSVRAQWIINQWKFPFQRRVDHWSDQWNWIFLPANWQKKKVQNKKRFVVEQLFVKCQNTAIVRIDMIKFKRMNQDYVKISFWFTPGVQKDHVYNCFFYHIPYTIYQSLYSFIFVFIH